MFIHQVLTILRLKACLARREVGPARVVNQIERQRLIVTVAQLVKRFEASDTALIDTAAPLLVHRVLGIARQRADQSHSTVRVPFTQVALAWLLQQGFAVIPSSTKRENLAANLKAQALRLIDDGVEIERAEAATKRLVHGLNALFEEM